MCAIYSCRSVSSHLGGVHGVGAEEVWGPASVEMKVMNCAKRLNEVEWTCELSTKPKLTTLRLLKVKGI